jgi:hypothetical protein
MMPVKCHLISQNSLLVDNSKQKLRVTFQGICFEIFGSIFGRYFKQTKSEYSNRLIILFCYNIMSRKHATAKQMGQRKCSTLNTSTNYINNCFKTVDNLHY